MRHLDRYVTPYLPTEIDDIKPDTPLFWSTFGQRRQGLVRRPMEGKNVWRLCKTYGRLIGYPMLKPHDLLTAWQSRSTSSTAASSRCAACSATHASNNAALRSDPPGRAEAGRGVLRGEGARHPEQNELRVLSPVGDVSRTCSLRTSTKSKMVAPTGFEPVFQP
jgi:hypothetical protein